MRLSILLSLTWFVASAWPSEAVMFAPSAAAPADQQWHTNESVPPITLIRDAEFIIQKLRVVSDSRSAEVRTKEIRATLGEVVRRATASGIIVRFGESQVTPEQVGEIPIRDLSKSSDTSFAEIQLKQPLQGQTRTQIIDAIERSLVDLKPEGRSEIMKTEFGIGLDNPEKLRQPLIEAMVKDIKQIHALINPNYQINITGLDQRLKWRRVAFAQLEFYLDYRFTITPPPPAK